MDKAEEKALVRKLIRMDDRAWEGFCTEYARPLLGFVQLCFGCDVEKGEEIVQMTFIRCVRSIRTFDPSRGRLFEWLKTVARNEGHTLVGEDRTRRLGISLSSINQHTADNILATIDKAPLPEELLARKDVQTLIHQCLAEMNTRHRQVLISKYLNGLKVSQIAVRLGSSEKAVESLLSRSRESFRNLFLKKSRKRTITNAEMPK